MSDVGMPPLRKEVQNYLRSCEHLLSIAATPTNPSFTREELQIMNYYVGELARMVGQLAKT
jgi:hypothetical protein